MDFDVIGAFATLLTPLGAMAGAIFVLGRRRIQNLEKQNANLLKYVLTTCANRADKLEDLADIIVKNNAGGEA